MTTENQRAIRGDRKQQVFERVEKLRARISEWDISTSEAEGTGEALSEEDVRALGSLGYLD